jgi:Fe-S cluster biogenesis protein NfuA
VRPSPDRDAGALLDEVRAVLDAAVAPALRGHLGGIDATAVDEQGRVHVRFTGACTTCAYRKMTLVGAVYPRLAAIDGVEGIACEGVPVTPRELDRMLEAYGMRPAPARPDRTTDG